MGYDLRFSVVRWSSWTLGRIPERKESVKSLSKVRKLCAQKKGL